MADGENMDVLRAFVIWKTFLIEMKGRPLLSDVSVSIFRRTLLGYDAGGMHAHFKEY